MVKNIMHDPLFLSRPSLSATQADLPTLQDLLDTLAHQRSGCVGMAANMIGVHKRIIVFDAGGFPMGMLNPEITAQSGPYETTEGCLSLPGERTTTRYRQITVRFQNALMQTRTQTFTGFTAQIIQHEIDHCNGVLI